MKINKDYATSIYDNVLPITEQQQTQFTRDNTDKSTESLASYIAHSLSVSGMNVSTNWKDMCQYLDAKIVASRKTASFWDGYNIKGTLNSPQDFDSSVASLANSSGCIVNCDSFMRDNETYTRGDIICKDFYGKIIHIASIQSGYYEPNSISAVEESPGVYNLTFNFHEGTSIPESTTKELSLTTTETPDNKVYNLQITLTSGATATLVLNKVDSTLIKPIWETRLTSTQERILNAVTVQYTNEQAIFTNTSKLSVDLIAK